MKRWLAEIAYRTAEGPLLVPHDLEEIEELDEIVEAGPDWNTIVRIEITLQRPTDAAMTIEQDEGLWMSATQKREAVADLTRRFGPARKGRK